MIAAGAESDGRRDLRRRCIHRIARTLSLCASLAIAQICLVPASRGAGEEPVAQEAKTAKPAGWKELRLPEPPGGRQAAGQARRMLSDGQITDQKVFDAYWQYYLSQITWYERNNELPAHRKEFKGQLRTRKGPPQERLVKTIATKLMSDIGRDKEFNVLVRFNAVLLLGELNRVEPDSRGQGAVALPEALPILMQFLDPKVPVNDTNDALRDAALIGLEYQAKHAGLRDANAKKKVVDRIQQMVKDKEPPSGRDPLVHEWLLHRAQSVLDALINPDNAVARDDKVTGQSRIPRPVTDR